MNIYPSFPVVFGCSILLGQGPPSPLDESRLPQRRLSRNNEGPIFWVPPDERSQGTWCRLPGTFGRVGVKKWHPCYSVRPTSLLPIWQRSPLSLSQTREDRWRRNRVLQRTGRVRSIKTSWCSFFTPSWPNQVVVGTLTGRHYSTYLLICPYTF